MRPVDIASIAFCVLIIGLVLFAFYRHGRGNPETTGAIARRQGAIEKAMAMLETSLEGCATRGALDLLAEQVRNLEAHAASSGEMNALEQKINGMDLTLNAKIDGVRHAADRTEAAVSRIEGYFLQKGVNG
jgi:outer membrane murein-binding lipoprotein Lpp